MKKKLTRVICLLLLPVMALTLCGCRAGDYRDAKKLYEEGLYSDAAAAFDALGDYKDSKDMASECRYTLAEAYLERGRYAKAYLAFAEIADYSDASDRCLECLRDQLTGVWQGTGDENATTRVIAHLNENGTAEVRNFVSDSPGILNRGTWDVDEDSVVITYDNGETVHWPLTLEEGSATITYKGTAMTPAK